MRILILGACALAAGCFKPANPESCQYRCASQGTPCPGGLSCVAGMCVAAGDSCSGGDGGVDAPTDAQPKVCGDGIRAVGEVCYLTPLTFIGTDVTYDAQLADINADGNLDLTHLIGDQWVFNPNVGGMISNVSVNGPTLFANLAIARDIGDSAHAELLTAGAGGAEAYAFSTNTNSYVSRGSTSVGATEGEPVAMTLARITTGSTRNLVVLYPSSILLVGISAVFGMTNVGGTGAVMGGTDIASGAFDSDLFDDVLVALPTGITMYRGSGTGFATSLDTTRTGATSGVAVGDTDGDDQHDVVFTVAGASGQIGVMKGLGASAFQAPTTINVPDVARVIEASDIDGDDRADVIAARHGANRSLVISLAKPDGTLTAPVELPISVDARYLNVGPDFNHDNVPDIVVTDPNSMSMLVYVSNP